MTRHRLPRLRPRTRRRLVAGGLAGLTAAALIAGWVETSAPTAPRPGAVALAGRASSSDRERSAGTHAATTDAGPGGAQAPPIGVYTGPGGASVAEAVAAELGGRVPYALEFLPRTSWTTLTDPTWVAQQWHGTPFDLVLGVPMLPNAGATLAQGAAGAYDAQFRTLADRLVHDGLGNTILMLGYQPDDASSPWYVGSRVTARQYVRFWDIIRSTMSAVPGADFLFEWDAGDAATSPVSPAAMYPGNAAVDIVATDAFDFVAGTPSTAGHWSTVLGERFGPAWMASFAAAHRKPMAIAMWGEMPTSEGGAGDRPAYVSQLLRWAAAHRLVMCVLWDYQAMTLTGGEFPKAAAALRQAVTAASSGPGSPPSRGKAR